MQRILLLGGCGFLGRNITQTLSHDNFTVIVFDKNKSCHIESAKFYQGDINDTDSIINIIKQNSITTVFHCVSSLLPSSDSMLYIYDIDHVLSPSIKILDCCVENGIKFIFISSGGTIYGNTKDKILSEEVTPSPISFYGLSKFQMENLILFYHRRYGLDYIILRPSNPFGYGQNLYGRQGLIAVLIGKLLKGENAVIYGDGSSIRDYIYINDFNYYIKEILNNNIANVTINIGSGKGYSIKQIITYLENITRKKIHIEYTESRKTDVARIVLDISKLNSLVPYNQIDIESGIADFYNKIIKEKTINYVSY
jgi:UDP-glucose 4-epimerase